MSQFKSGDLALTLISKGRIPAMGVVELEVFIQKWQAAIRPDHSIWIAPYAGWAALHLNMGLLGFFRAEELIPLRGDFQPEQQKSREVVE